MSQYRYDIDSHFYWTCSEVKELFINHHQHNIDDINNIDTKRNHKWGSRYRPKKIILIYHCKQLQGNRSWIDINTISCFVCRYRRYSIYIVPCTYIKSSELTRNTISFRDLEDNKIKTLPAGIFDQLVNLKDL
jgi:hypothetical protein